MLEELKKIAKNNEVSIKNNCFELIINNKKDHLPIIKELKSNNFLTFDQLIDITSIDHPSRNQRFELVYIFLSMIKNIRLIVKIHLKEDEGVESISSIHAAVKCVIIGARQKRQAPCCHCLQYQLRREPAAKHSPTR